MVVLDKVFNLNFSPGGKIHDPAQERILCDINRRIENSVRDNSVIENSERNHCSQVY